MYTLLLIRDLPNQQSLEAPFAIVVQDFPEVIEQLVRLARTDIAWDRIIISKKVEDVVVDTQHS